MVELIYPPFYRYRPKFIPISYDLKTQQMVGTQVEKENKYWGKIYSKLSSIYNVPPRVLPKRTIVYRCSVDKNPMAFGKSKIGSTVIYFGLDFVISVWIALEIEDRRPKELPLRYYLHCYELTADIPYKYIDERGTIPEINSAGAAVHNFVHPQRILHGDVISDENNELGTELTFPRRSDYKKLITPVQSYGSDISKLIKNRDKFIFQWDPKNALFSI